MKNIFEYNSLAAYRKCPKPEPDIFAKSDACNECEKHFKSLNLDVVVTIVFWANFMNEQTQNNRQRNRSLNIFIQSPES